jgi:hypothetical protein
MNLTIKIKPSTEPGPNVSIHWEDAPDNVAETAWDVQDQAWTKICDGIHMLLSNLGPSPEHGWDVVFTCPDPSLIIEENLTQEKYWERNDLDV